MTVHMREQGSSRLSLLWMRRKKLLCAGASTPRRHHTATARTRRFDRRRTFTGADSIREAMKLMLPHLDRRENPRLLDLMVEKLR